MKKHEELFMRIINLNLMVLGQLPPTPKLTLTQTLTLTRGNFPLGQLSGCHSTLNLTLTLTEIKSILNLMGYWKRNVVSVSIIVIFKR